MYTQSVQNLSSTETWFQNSVVTKPYVETSHMNNQKKTEFIDDIFHMQSIWGGHGEISPKTWFIQEGAICPDFLIQQTGRVPNSRNSQIPNHLDPFYGPSESWESLPIWYLGLPEFWPIWNPNVKIGSAVVLSRKKNSAATSIVKIP
jgi:hypothetical protein